MIDWGPILSMIGIVAVAVITALGSAHLASKNRPIQQAEADTAAAVALLGTSGTFEALNTALNKEIERKAEEMAELREEVRNLGTEVRSLRTEVKANEKAVRVMQLWIDDLHNRWEYHRKNDNPPPRPNI